MKKTAFDVFLSENLKSTMFGVVAAAVSASVGYLLGEGISVNIALGGFCFFAFCHWGIQLKSRRDRLGGVWAQRFRVQAPKLEDDEPNKVAVAELLHTQEERSFSSVRTAVLTFLHLAYFAFAIEYSYLAVSKAQLPRSDLAGHLLAGAMTYINSLYITLPLSWVIYHYIPLDQWRSKRPAVVFRRFGKDADDLSVCFLISQACKGLAHPITLQDQSYRGEIGIRYFGLLSLALLALPVALLFLTSGKLISGFQAGLAIVIVYYALAWLRAVHKVPVSRKSFELRINGLVNRITSGKERYDGVQTIRLGDECWRDGVQLAISKAKFILIDISSIIHGTDGGADGNLLWEVDAAFSSVPPEQIVLMTLAPPGQRLLGVFDKRCIDLVLEAGSRTERCKLERARLHFYTSEDIRSDRTLGYPPLNLQIARCIAWSGPHGLPPTQQNAA
jgi:hypothetical protein